MSRDYREPSYWGADLFGAVIGGFALTVFEWARAGKGTEWDPAFPLQVIAIVGFLLGCQRFVRAARRRKRSWAFERQAEQREGREHDR